MTDDLTEWGPWIEHDGNGAPSFKDGEGLWIKLADPEDNMSHYDDVIFTVGQTYKDHRVFGVSSGGSSWVLPITEDGRLYVYRYRIRKPRGMAILESILTDLPTLTELVAS